MTATVILKKKSKTDIYGYLNIRYFDGKGKRKIISLDEKILVSDFDTHYNSEFQRFTNKFEDYRRVNKKILSKINDNVFESDITFVSSEKSFISYFTTYLKLIPNENTKNSYSAVLLKLTVYIESINKSDLLFSEIDNTFVLELRNYLLSKVAGSTAKQYLIILKTVLNTAKREGLYVEKYNYFSKLNITTNYSNKKILTLEDITILFNINQYTDGKPTKHFYTRNMLLTSILCSGIRVSDLFFIRVKDIDFKLNVIRIITKKTSTNLNIPFNDKLIKVLIDIFGTSDVTKPMGHGYYGLHLEDKTKVNIDYNLKYLEDKLKTLPRNYLVFNEFISTETSLLDYDKLKEETPEQNKAMTRLRGNYNYHLKSLAKDYKLDIKVISSHVGRYSWTNLLLDIADVSVVDIQRSLGHKKIMTTMNYLDRHFSLDKLENIGASLSDKIKI